MPKKDTKLQKLSESIYIAVEEMHGLGIEGLDRMFMKEYLQQAGQLTDSRQQIKIKHTLKDIVGIVFFAVLAGNDEWTEIADFAIDEKDILKKYLELPGGIPSHDTIQRVFGILRPDERQSMLVHILIRLITVAGKQLDEYLYRNDSLGCCIRDVIAVNNFMSCHRFNLTCCHRTAHLPVPVKLYIQLSVLGLQPPLDSASFYAAENFLTVPDAVLNYPAPNCAGAMHSS